MEIFNPNSNIDFLGWRRVSVGISIFLMVASVAFILTRGLNYGLDFTGGVMVETKFEQPVEIAEVRAALAKGGFPHAVVQSVGGSKEVAIRIRGDEGPAHGGEAPPAVDAKPVDAKPVDAKPVDAKPTSADATPVDSAAASAASESAREAKQDLIAGKVLAAIQATRPDATIKRSGFVGPQVGEELRTDGVIAVLFVIIGIMVYIGLRFEKRFALAAIASEFHDTIITIGIFALTQREFDITVLASVLSVVGYSINDKVVVFDRVRELFRSARKGSSEEILNRAINSTLSRTIITSLFTGITMIALYIFGGPIMEGFALTMVIGIIVGTLSSIFFASPILFWLGVSKKDLMPVTKDNPELARRP
jgi:preprotein translocase subunit SecF